MKSVTLLALRRFSNYTITDGTNEVRLNRVLELKPVQKRERSSFDNTFVQGFNFMNWSVVFIVYRGWLSNFRPDFKMRYFREVLGHCGLKVSEGIRWLWLLLSL